MESVLLVDRIKNKFVKDSVFAVETKAKNSTKKTAFGTYIVSSKIFVLKAFS